MPPCTGTVAQTAFYGNLTGALLNCVRCFNPQEIPVEGTCKSLARGNLNAFSAGEACPFTQGTTWVSAS
jgi:hypothetical protein